MKFGCIAYVPLPSLLKPWIPKRWTRLCVMRAAGTPPGDLLVLFMN
jgi:hypothetical protein